MVLYTWTGESCPGAVCSLLPPLVLFFKGGLGSHSRELCAGFLALLQAVEPGVYWL